MWGSESWFPALVASSCVSGLFLAFFLLENCVNAQCPYSVPTSSVPLPRVNTEILVQLAREAVHEGPWDFMTAGFLCITKSQIACLATITFAWSTASCALLLLLSLLCPDPRREEKAAFRDASVFSFLQQAVMLIYLAGVEGNFQVGHLSSLQHLCCLVLSLHNAWRACNSVTFSIIVVVTQLIANIAPNTATYCPRLHSCACPGGDAVSVVLVLQVLLQAASIRAATAQRSY